MVTSARYLTPKGRDIAAGGITPDVLVTVDPSSDLELRLNSNLVSEPTDPMVAKALEWLSTKISNARHVQ